jgi:hypothetical protein
MLFSYGISLGQLICLHVLIGQQSLALTRSRCGE